MIGEVVFSSRSSPLRKVEGAVVVRARFACSMSFKACLYILDRWGLHYLYQSIVHTIFPCVSFASINSCACRISSNLNTLAT